MLCNPSQVASFRYLSPQTKNNRDCFLIHYAEYKPLIGKIQLILFVGLVTLRDKSGQAFSPLKAASYAR